MNYHTQDKTQWTKTYLIGQSDGKNIYLKPPSWDCGWYWGFGYLGNNNCHYHLDGLNKGKNQHLKDAINEHFTSHIFKNESLLWEFCELVLTAYSLKENAEVLGRGGSHTTTNPCAELIKNPDEVTRINQKVLPAIFDAIEKNILANMEYNKFLESKDGLFIITDGYYNQSLDLMTYDEAVKFIDWQKQGGFDVAKLRIEKLKQGANHKTSKGGDLVKLYNVETGECHCLLENSIFTKEANAKFIQKILNYVKG